MTIDTDYIFVPGPGVLLWQTYTAVTANQFKQMRTFGATGGITITTTREIIGYSEGTPETDVVRDVIKESGVVEILLAEKSLEDLTTEFGYGTVSTAAGGAVASEEHHIWLRSDGYHLIAGVPASGTISTVVSTDTTPVSYTVTTDYLSGTVEATLAIKRVTTGSITDGQEVVVTVAYTRPARKYLTMGGANSITYNHLMHHKAFRDGVLRELTYIYKASTNGEVVENYNKRDYSERTVRFSMIADTTRTAGDRLWDKRQEYV